MTGGHSRRLEPPGRGTARSTIRSSTFVARPSQSAEQLTATTFICPMLANSRLRERRRSFFAEDHDSVEHLIPLRSLEFRRSRARSDWPNLRELSRVEITRIGASRCECLAFERRLWRDAPLSHGLAR